jgi:O-antigen/teichoic acid export membrane protein
MSNTSGPVSLFNFAFAIMQREIFVQILNLLTGVIVARTLGPEMLGVWVLLTLVSAYAEGFGRLKTDVSSIYILGSQKVREEVILFSTSLFAIFSSLAIVAIFFWQFDFLESLLFKGPSGSYREELVWIILLIPLEFLLVNLSYFFISLENILFYNRIKVLQAILNFFFMVVLIIFLDLSLWALVIARIFSTVIPLIYAWKRIEKHNWIKVFDRWDRSITIDILRYALPFYITGIVGTVNRLTTKSIAAFSLSTSQLAFFNQGEAGSRLLTVVPNSISVILYPRISKSDENDFSVELSLTSFRVTLLLLTFSGVLLFLIADPLIVFLYGIEFEKSAEVLKIAIPGVVIGSSCLSLQAFFEGVGKADMIPKLQVIPVILQIFFSYLLIDALGLLGASISFSLGYSLYGIVILIAFLKINKLSSLNIIPLVKDLKLIYNIFEDKFHSILKRNR